MTENEISGPRLHLFQTRVWYLINCPFVVTFLGALFVTTLSYSWQEELKKQEALSAYNRTIATHQINLLKELPSTFELSAGLLNDRFSRLLSMAKVRKKGDTDLENEAKLEIRMLEMQYHKAETPDGFLNLALSLFQCASVKDLGIQIKDEWKNFQGELELLIVGFNNYQLHREEIEKFEMSRNSSIEKMNKLLSEFMEGMSAELMNTRKGLNNCQ